jgi:serine/threonine protein kinase/tetratricopeptide (TPR) repeat protein
VDPHRFLRAKELLLQALELPEKQRPGFVEDRCGADAELRDEVLSLLQQEDRPASIVDEGPLASGAGLRLGSVIERLRGSASGQARSHPESIGPYRVLGVLGEGGMGIVYHARQDEPIQREVAIKVIRRGMDTERIVARFAWEKRSLARMDHPHIASVLDAGSDASGRPYFVMQLTPGAPITRYCDEHRLGLPERLQLFLKVCRAIQHAHQRGVLHRDLKPSNVLVRDVEGEAVPSVIDFGISKALLPEAEEDVLTLEGQRIGTPAYMSPEQVRSELESIDVRSDVYSLGVILYELLTGRHPLGAAATSFDASADLHDVTGPQAPSTAATQGEQTEELARLRNLTSRRLRRELSGDLDNICLMAVRPERERRYASVAHLVEDVERHLAGQPVRARPASWGYRLGKFVRRHRVGASLAAAATLFVILGIGFLLYHADRLGQERDRARTAETLAHQEAQTASEIAEFLEGLFNPVDPGEEGAADATARELLDRGAARIREELADQPAVRGRLLRVVGRVYQGLGLHGEAEDLLVESISALASADQDEELEGELGASMLLLGTTLHDQGRYDESEAMYRAAAKALGEAHGERSAERAEAISYLAVSVQAQGRLAEAVDLVREALDLNIERKGPDDPEVAWARNTLGYIYYKQGKLHEAETEFRRALQSQQLTLEGDHPDVANSLNNLGGMHLELGHLEEAATEFEEALAMYQRIYAEDHPALARAKQNLGRTLLARGELERARDLLEAAYASNVALLGPEHPSTTRTLLVLAQLHTETGEPERAESELKACLRTRRERDGDGSLAVMEAQAALGKFYLRSGQPARACDRLETVERDYAARYPPDHFELAKVRVDLAAAWLATGDTARAVTKLETAVPVLESCYGLEDARTLHAKDLLRGADETR